MRNLESFLDLVDTMRTAQKNYPMVKNSGTELAKLLILERQVDDMIEQMKINRKETEQ